MHRADDGDVDGGDDDDDDGVELEWNRRNDGNGDGGDDAAVKTMYRCHSHLPW